MAITCLGITSPTPLTVSVEVIARNPVGQPVLGRELEAMLVDWQNFGLGR